MKEEQEVMEEGQVDMTLSIYLIPLPSPDVLPLLPPLSIPLTSTPLQVLPPVPFSQLPEPANTPHPNGVPCTTPFCL